MSSRRTPTRLVSRGVDFAGGLIGWALAGQGKPASAFAATGRALSALHIIGPFWRLLRRRKWRGPSTPRQHRDMTGRRVRAVVLGPNKQPSRPIFSSCSGRLPGVVALSKARLATP